MRMLVLHAIHLGHLQDRSCCIWRGACQRMERVGDLSPQREEVQRVAAKRCIDKNQYLGPPLSHRLEHLHLHRRAEELLNPRRSKVWLGKPLRGSNGRRHFSIQHSIREEAKREFITRTPTCTTRRGILPPRPSVEQGRCKQDQAAPPPKLGALCIIVVVQSTATRPRVSTFALPRQRKSRILRSEAKRGTKSQDILSTPRHDDRQDLCIPAVLRTGSGCKAF
mmetsp:Transcript_52783/g.123069  ORF Transcript_52783/g.123069 Transcript_52783/m.123069 type:complete len:223 (-) Transcript_52783:345-1013(-)